MNMKRQKYKANRLAGMSQYKAAIAAGYKHGTAWNAHKKLEKACNFDELMVKQGLDDETLLEVLRKGIENIGVDGKPDMTAKAFIEIAMKLKGRLKDGNLKDQAGTLVDNSVKIMIVNKGNDGTIVHNREGRQDNERVDLVAEAVNRFEQPST